MVSTSIADPTIAVTKPSARRRPSWRRPVVGVLMATSTNAGTRGSRSPIVHQPPSSVRPSTASVPGASSVSTTTRKRVVVIWGVSMPMSTVGPDVLVNAPASRSARSPSHCGITGIPLGTQAPAGPSSTSTVRTRGTAAAASSVATRAAWAISAASTGVHGGHSRVLTVPGTGALASTIKVASIIAIPRPCRGSSGRCREPSP